MAFLSDFDDFPAIHAGGSRSAVAQGVAAARARGQSRRPVLILGGAAFCVAACLRITDPLLPDVAKSFAVATSAASIIVTAFALAYSLSQIVYGPIGDRFGKYPTITVAMTLSAVAIAAAATAGSLTALALFRLAAGLSTASVLPLALAYVGDAVAYEERQTVLARVLSGQLLGVIFGQAVGGVLIGFVNWRVVFLLLGGVFAGVAGLLWLELLSPRVARLRSPAPLAFGPLLGQYFALFAARRPRAALLAIFFEGMLFFGMLAYIGAFLRQRFGFGYVTVGLVLGAFGLGGLGYALCARRIVPAFGEAGMMRAGGGLIAASLIALALAPAPLVIMPLMAILGFGLYMVHNTLQTNATQMAPEARGAAVSLFTACFFLGQAIGAALLGIGIDRFGYGAVLATAGAGMLAIALWFASEVAGRA